MKYIVCLIVGIMPFASFAEDQLTAAMDARATEDCKTLEKQNDAFKKKNPEFFKDQMLYKTCYLNLRAMLDQCTIDYAKAIAARVKPTDSTADKEKVIKQEAEGMKGCMSRASVVTKDEVKEAAQDKSKSDAYSKRALDYLNSSPNKAK